MKSSPPFRWLDSSLRLLQPVLFALVVWAVLEVTTRAEPWNPEPGFPDGDGFVVASPALGAAEPEIVVEDCRKNSLVDGNATVDFGSIRITMSPGCVITVRNTGSGTLSGLSTELEGPDAAEFLVHGLAAPTLGPGASATIQVILIPSAIGLRTATLHIVSNDADESSFDILLTGTVVGPEIVTTGPLPTGMVGVPYRFVFEAGGGAAPYDWRSHNSLPAGLTLSVDGVLEGTPASVATNALVVSATGADGARSSIDTFELAVRAARGVGDPDPEFGQGGKVTTDFAGGDDFGYGVVVQGDGKIVVAGYAWIDATYQFALARYGVDGSLDATFGKGGRVTTDFGPTRAFGRSVALQGDGRILVAGESVVGGSYKFALVRYLPDGSLDPAFGSGGFITNRVGGTSFGKSVLVQSSGRIVLAGEVNRTGVDFGAARWLEDGVLDPAFGLGGVATADLGVSPNFDYPQGAALDPDDRIVVVGYVAGKSLSDFGLVRFQSHGVRDPSFGNEGVVTTSFGTAADLARCVVVRPDGGIVVAGEVGRDFGVACYLPSGVLDATFGGDGKVTTAVDRFEAFPRGMALSGDGAIVVAGYTSNGRDADFALVRFRPNGTPDPSFGSGGKLMTSVGPGHDRARSVVLQADGKIVVAGEAYNGKDYDFALVRYLGVLEPDLEVEQPAGVRLVDGGRGVRFGFGEPGASPVVRTFTLRNAGSAALTGLKAVVEGAHAEDFRLGTLPTTVLAPGAEIRFDVAFGATAVGVRSATLHIASNDADESPFDIPLAGTGGTATPLQAWRAAHFGSTDDRGDGANTNDFDFDGYVNLWEYATGGDPKVRDGSAMRPIAALERGNPVYTFLCNDRCTDIAYLVQASVSLKPDSWIDIAAGVGGGVVRPQGALCEVNDSGKGLRPVRVTLSSKLFPDGPVFLRMRVSE